MSDFFKTPTHRLTVFHPTLCTKKKILAKGIESNFPIPISIELDGVHHKYFKLRL